MKTDDFGTGVKARANLNAPRVLVVDDELLQQKITTRQLKQMNFHAVAAGSAAEAFQFLRDEEFDVVLLDVQMPVVSGLEALPLIAEMQDAPEVIMLTLDQSLASGLAAMRAGAYDYLTKPIAAERLEVVVTKAAEKRTLARRTASIYDFVGKSDDVAASGATLVRASGAMRKIAAQADRIAELDSTVLITGESGTGKDVLARHIHRRSRRARLPMIAVNCAALTETLFESEFFGYEKGAFTGAEQTRRGLIEAADGATLFLDEIGEMSPAAQVKLLRFLESGHFRRVGSTREQFADTRLIAATNKDLRKAVAENRFRLDLYYRLNVIELHVPPLRARRADLAVLIEHFLEFYREQFGKKVLTLSVEARRKLDKYRYPGNVRELKNIIERAAALAPNGEIEAAQIIFQTSAAALSADFLRSLAAASDSADAEFDLPFADDAAIARLEDLERRYILAVLHRANGKRDRAAALLGISERTLYRRLRDYE